VIPQCPETLKRAATATILFSGILHRLGFPSTFDRYLLNQWKSYSLHLHWKKRGRWSKTPLWLMLRPIQEIRSVHTKGDGILFPFCLCSPVELAQWQVVSGRLLKCSTPHLISIASSVQSVHFKAWYCLLLFLQKISVVFAWGGVLHDCCSDTPPKLTLLRTKQAYMARKEVHKGWCYAKPQIEQCMTLYIATSEKQILPEFILPLSADIFPCYETVSQSNCFYTI
jgi:hypothetical protein